jgi:predicted DNA-binding protein (UPF0251 family)
MYNKPQMIEGVFLLEKQVYTIAETAEELGVSQVTVYKKLKLKEFKVHKKKSNGDTVIEAEGVELIRDSLKRNKPDVKLKQEIKVEENDMMREELREKNKQIEQLQKMLENMQQLLLNEQKKSILLIENKDNDKLKFWKKLFKNA